MGERRKIICGKKYIDKKTGKQKVWWTTIGSGFRGDNGWFLNFDYLPTKEQSWDLVIMSNNDERSKAAENKTANEIKDDVDELF